VAHEHLDGVHAPADPEPLAERLADPAHHEAVGLAEPGQGAGLRAHVADLDGAPRALGPRALWPRAAAGRSRARRAAAPVEATRRKWRRATALASAMTISSPPQNCTGVGGILPLAERAGSSGVALAH